MDIFVDSLLSAIYLVCSFDREMMAVVIVSLKVSCVSTSIAAIFGVPFGFYFSTPTAR